MIGLSFSARLNREYNSINPRTDLFVLTNNHIDFDLSKQGIPTKASSPQCWKELRLLAGIPGSHLTETRCPLQKRWGSWFDGGYQRDMICEVKIDFPCYKERKFREIKVSSFRSEGEDGSILALELLVEGQSYLDRHEFFEEE